MAASSHNVDFSNVKEGGNFNKKRISAGDYLAKITKVEDAPSKADQVPQYLFTIKIEKHPTSVLPYYCKLQENQLWKLRNILIAGGLTVPKKKVKVDVNRLVGKLIGVTVDDAEYEGKEQSELAAVFPAAELGEVEDVDDDSEEAEEAEESEEEEAEEAEEEVEEEPEEEETEGDEYDALDRLELRKVLKKLDPDLKTSTKQSDDDLRELIRGLVNADAEAEDEPDEEEEEEAPAPKAKPKAKVAAKPVAKKRSIAEVSDDELEEIDIDDL